MTAELLLSKPGETGWHSMNGRSVRSVFSGKGDTG